MKRHLLAILLMFTLGQTNAVAQKFALIDMEYILDQIPAYKQANDRLEANSKQWQNEVEKKSNEAKQLYQDYQKQVAKLSDAQRSQKEEAVIAKEKEANDLRRKYFGPEGEMYKMKANLIDPIENEIYEAVKELAGRRGYAAVIDRASANSLIFASPDIDVSNDVLAMLGYSN